MLNIITKIELQLEQLAKAVIKRPGVFLAGCMAFIVLLAAGMPSLYIEVSNESMLHDGDPTLQQYKAFQQQFGRDDAVVAAISSTNVFSPVFLSKLKAFHQDLEAEVPYLDLVTSLVSVTSVSDSKGDLLIGNMEDIWPGKQADFSAFKNEIVNNPLYRNLIISEDGNTTLLIIQANAYASEKESKLSFKQKVASMHDRFMDYMAGTPNDKKSNSSQIEKSVSGKGELDLGAFSDDLQANTTTKNISAGMTKPLTTPQLNSFINAIKEVTKKHDSNEFSIRLAGGQMIDAEHKDSIHIDLFKLLPIIFVMVFIVLYFVLRRPSAVYLSLLVVVLSLMATLGVMGWIGFPITPVAVALPPLILTIGVGDSVHMLSIYFNRFSETGDRDASIVYAVRRTGVAILFTSLTTAAGFMAFIISDIKSIADFGMLSALGVMFALFLSLVLLPAILSKMKAPVKNNSFDDRWNGYANALTKLTRVGLNHPQKIIIAIVFIVIVSVPGIMNLRFSHDVLSWFPKETPVRVNTVAIDSQFSGTIPMEVIIDTGKVNGIYNPDFMRKVELFEKYTQSLQAPKIDMGRTTSVVDTLKRIHQVISNNQTLSIPENEKLIAQELLLFEGSGSADVEKLIDSQFSKLRITVRMSWADAADYVPVRFQVEDKAKKFFSDAASVTVTGSIDMVSRSLVGVMQSMSSSYLIAVIAISLMLIFLTRSILYGLVGMIPNVLPIIITLGVMGYTDYPINMFTVLLGGIALGLAVDDTVHFMHGYRYRRQEQGMSMEESIMQTIASTGPALLFTTLAITAGFFMFTLSVMDSLFYFGLFLGLTLINALIADIIIVPAAIKTLERFKAYTILNATDSVPLEEN